MTTRSLLAALLLISFALGMGSSVLNGEGGPAPKDQAVPPPVRNWGDWWPKTQFGKNDSVSKEAIRDGDRSFESVGYGGVSTPWDPCFASLRHAKKGGVRFNLVWSGPGAFASEEERAKFKSPKRGDVKAAIVRGKTVLRKPTNGELSIGGWFGGGLGSSGNMMIFFDWLPADFKDYWVRIDMLKERHWFLIPYGFGAELGKTVDLTPVVAEGPVRPEQAKPEDKVHCWNSVSYELGVLKKSGWHISATVSNPFDTEISIELYRENGQWEIVTPRTSAVYNWPAGYSRFCSWSNISRAESMRRWDEYKFWRTPFDIRTWGMLRVTVEDHVFEKVVPSSLFHYTHGRIQRDR